MPRVAARQSKPSVITQTLEIPTTQSASEETTKETRPSFWEYMQGLSSEEWKNHIVYVTRELPKTHMNGIGGGYLVKMVEPFDIEDIKVAYGGYEFSYIMKNKNEVVYSGRFRIEAPPKLDAARETTIDNNGGSTNIIQQFVSMLRDELERSRTAGGADKSTTEKAVEMLSKASDSAMEMIKKQVPEAAAAVSPASQLKELVITAKELGIIPTAGGVDGGIIKTIEVLKTLGLIAQPAAARDPAKELETMLGIFTKLDELRGGGGGGRRPDWKATLIDKGLEALPQVLDTFRQTREANVEIARSRASTAESLRHMQPPSPRPGVASVMTPRPAAGHPGSIPEPVVTANSGLRTVPLDQAERTAPAEAAPAEMVFETIDPNSTAFTNFIKQRIVEMVARGDHGEQIVDFLDGAKPGFSNTLVQYPPDQLTAYFALDPILRPAAEHPNWNEVLDEARKYILTPAEGEEENELEPAAAGKRGKPN